MRAARLSELVAAHPEFVAVSYEQMLADPLRAFPALAARVGLEWSDRTQAELLASNQRGVGFEVNRQWDEERRRTPELSPRDLATVQAVLADFPISDQRSDPSLPGVTEP